jgi:hypothetical protein
VDSNPAPRPQSRATRYARGAAEFAEKVRNCGLQVPSRESHIRPLLTRLDADEDRIAVWRDVLNIIREDQLWRIRHNVATFEEYCEQRWEMPRQHAYRLIGASKNGELFVTQGLRAPTAERHIRPLLERLEADEDRIAVWRDVLATTNGAKIKAAAKERQMRGQRKGRENRHSKAGSRPRGRKPKQRKGDVREQLAAMAGSGGDGTESRARYPTA